jgi:membrane protein
MNLTAFIQILRRTYTRFNEDGCFYRASAIAYAIVLSAIPLLVVLVKYASWDQETIRAYLSRFMGAYGIQDASEFLGVLDEILKRANTIAIAGTVFMVFSATSILRHIEDSFNHIVRSSTERPLVFRFALYISGIVIVPAVLTLTAGGFQFMLSQLHPPEWKSMATNGNTLWLLGRQLHWRSGEQTGELNLARKIDRKASYKDIYFDMQTGRAGRSFEILGETPPRELEGRDLRSLTRVAANDGVLYVIGETGTLFFSRDNGRTFDYRIFAFKGQAGLRTPIFEDILALPGKRALILATVGSQSCVVDFRPGGYGMQCFSNVYSRIVQLSGKKSEIFLTGTGRLRRSDDGGFTWFGPFDERFGSRSLPIAAMARDDKGRTYLAGGALWIRDAESDIFPEIRSEREIHGLSIDSEGKGFLYGADGLFRYTMDRGNTWHSPANGDFETTFFAHQDLGEGRTALAGENGTFMIVGEPQLTAMTDDSGHPLVEFKIFERQSASAVLTFLSRATLWLLVYGILGGLLYAAYKYIPTYPLSSRSSALSAWITATALIVFVTGFQIWVVGFANTGRIYGVWAVVPVGMLLLLFCTQILFFGLELACVLDEQRNPQHFAETRVVKLAPPLALSHIVEQVRKIGRRKPRS